MYTISYDDGGQSIFQATVGIMEETGRKFSRVLNEEFSRSPEDRKYIQGYCPSWVRLRGEMRRRGMQGLLSEIIILEQEFIADEVEKELVESYNDGDSKKVDLCRKTLDGLIGKTRLSMAKIESDDRKIMATIGRMQNQPKLKSYSTDDLKKMLKVTKEEINEVHS